MKTIILTFTTLLITLTTTSQIVHVDIQDITMTHMDHVPVANLSVPGNVMKPDIDIGVWEYANYLAVDMSSHPWTTPTYETYCFYEPNNGGIFIETCDWQYISENDNDWHEGVWDVSTGIYSTSSTRVKVPFKMDLVSGDGGPWIYGYLDISWSKYSLTLHGWYYNSVPDESMYCNSTGLVSVDEYTLRETKDFDIYDLMGRKLSKKDLPINQVLIKLYSSGKAEKLYNTQNSLN
jgi:hypothetical protein